jgi:hypothetical protein
MKREARIKIARELVSIANDLVPKRTRKADAGDYTIVVNVSDFFEPANLRSMTSDEWEKALEYIDEAYWDSAMRPVENSIKKALKRRERQIIKDGLRLK